MLEGRLERLGEALKRRLGGQASFVEGFVWPARSPASARWRCWAPSPPSWGRCPPRRFQSARSLECLRDLGTALVSVPIDP